MKDIFPFEECMPLACLVVHVPYKKGYHMDIHVYFLSILYIVILSFLVKNCFSNAYMVLTMYVSQKFALPFS